MNLRDVRSSAVPVKAKPEAVGARYDGGNGATLMVRQVSSHNGRARFAACLCHRNGTMSEMTGTMNQPSFSQAQRKLDAYAKRGGYGRVK